MGRQMPTAAPARRVAPPAAAQAAERNWRANHAALSLHQPAHADALAASEPDVTWALARDGSLSARGPNGQWVAGCSVPLLAGRALLRSLTAGPGGQCLLAPAHAGLVVAARERLGPDAVLFVVQPDLDRCRVILGCADLAADLAAGRLWFAAGEGWAAELHRTLDAHPGLATPARFIQTRLTGEDVLQPLIAEVQRKVGVLATVRADALDRRLNNPAPTEPGRTVVIAGSRWRLWKPGADLLSTAVAATPACTAITYDTDDPLTAASIAMAAAVDGAAAVVSLDVCRAAAAPVLPTHVPWITWLTTPAVPAHDGAGPHDRLIVADAAWVGPARDAGWPADRVHVGSCPPLLPTLPLPVKPTLGLIADAAPVQLPDAVGDYSSQRVLWDAIAAEVQDNPLVVDDATAYVTDRAKRMNIDAEELDLTLFVEALVLPVYAQALARLLAAAGLPLRLWGHGWDDRTEFRHLAAGSVVDVDAFQAAVAASTILVRHTPGRPWHPVESTGRPVLSAAGHTTASYLAQATALLRSPPVYMSRRGETLQAAVAQILRR